MHDVDAGMQGIDAVHPSVQWRIQDLQTGVAKVERRRREYRGAEGAEGVDSPSPENFFDFRSKNVDF